MRYSSAHAAKSGSVPFMLRGPKSLRSVMTAAVAGIVGLVPTVLVASPAMADTNGSITVDVTTASVTEGGTLVFTVKNGSLTTPATVDLTTAGGTALAGSDFTAPASPIVVAANTTVSVSVATTADSLYEGGSATSETVVLRAELNGATSNYGTATGAIVDGDSVPTYSLSVAPDPVLESSGSPTATITATLTKRSSTATYITLNSVDGTAKVGFDYTPLSAQTLTIPVNQLTATATVNVTKDTVTDTADIESFTVNSTSAGVIQPTTTAAASVPVTIKDAQATPVLTLTGGGSIAEGGTLNYGLSLDHGSEKEITVDWDSMATTGSPAPAAATPGTDFTYPLNRTVTIPVRQTVGSISVATLKDSLDEAADESFDVQLKSPQNVTLGSPSKVTGTITQGKDAPKVTILPATAVEGNSGRTAATFTATLSAASTQTVKVDWTTAPDGSAGYGKAIPGTDFVTKTGTLTFAPGVVTQNFSVEVLGDTVDEASTGGVQSSSDGETFLLNLTRPTGDYSIDLSDPGASRTIKILDDDAAPTLIFADKSQKEGNDTTALLTPVTLSNASDHPITVAVTTDTGSTADTGALAGPGGFDYSLLNSTVTIPAEQTSGYPLVLVNGDTINETDEVINLKATPSANSEYLSTGATARTAKVTLENDDEAPDLEVNSVAGQEGATVVVTGTVTGSRQGNAQVAVTFAGGSSQGSMAASAGDFDNPGVKVIDIPWGTLNNTVLKIADVPLLADTAAEPAETIIATGSGISNTATVTEGIITIAANGTGPTDPTPDPTDPTPDPTDPTPDPTDPTPDPTAPPIPTNITLSALSTFRLGVGDVILSGTAAPGASVQPYARPLDSDAGLVVYGAPVEADDDGYFTFVGRFTHVGYDFAAVVGDESSEILRINLKEDPTLTLRSTTMGQASLTVVGDPSTRGLRVRVVRRNDNGTYTTVGTGILDATGHYRRTVTGMRSGGAYYFKATVYGDGDLGLLTNTTAAQRLVLK